MQKLVRIVFLSIALIYLGGMIYQVGYFAYFKSNQDEIAKKYCVNKDKPEMHCNGQCHLKKELQKTQWFDVEEPQENEQSRLPQLELNFLIAILPQELDQNTEAEGRVLELIWYTPTDLCCEATDSCWHPPKV